jgi:hypothetical protein
LGHIGWLLGWSWDPTCHCHHLLATIVAITVIIIDKTMNLKVTTTATTFGLIIKPLLQGPWSQSVVIDNPLVIL